METTCHASYPLKSENASPFGTCTVYLSCWARAMLPKAATDTAMITITEDGILMMAHSCAHVCNGVRRHRRSRLAEATPQRRAAALTAEPAGATRYSESDLVVPLSIFGALPKRARPGWGHSSPLQLVDVVRRCCRSETEERQSECKCTHGSPRCCTWDTRAPRTRPPCHRDRHDHRTHHRIKFFQQKSPSPDYVCCIFARMSRRRSKLSADQTPARS